MFHTSELIHSESFWKLWQWHLTTDGVVNSRNRTHLTVAFLFGGSDFENRVKVHWISIFDASLRQKPPPRHFFSLQDCFRYLLTRSIIYWNAFRHFAHYENKSTIWLDRCQIFVGTQIRYNFLRECRCYNTTSMYILRRILRGSERSTSSSEDGSELGIFKAQHDALRRTVGETANKVIGNATENWPSIYFGRFIINQKPWKHAPLFWPS